MFSASVDLLEYLKLDSYAQIVRDAIYKAVNVEKLHTPDLGGKATTSDVADYIINEVKSQTQVKVFQSQA